MISEEEKQQWRKNSTKQTEGYLDIDQLKYYLEGAEIRRKVAQDELSESVYKITKKGCDDNFLRAQIEQANKEIAFLKEEIEHFPHLPVLPPTAPLIKISGIIEEVTFTKAMACFEAEAYSTVQEELARKRERDNAGAALAMIVQSLADDPSRAIINDGKPKKTKCLYVKGKVSGKSFSGWFGMTNIRVGDYVEMAAMPDGDAYLVYAIANPEQRTVSFVPRCNSNGNLYTLPISLFTSFAFLLVIYLPIVFLSHGIVAWLTFYYVVIATALGLYMYKTEKNEHGVHFSLFREIAVTLELPGGEKFDLRHAAVKKRKENSWVPRVNGETPMPQQEKGDYAHEYFYYY